MKLLLSLAVVLCGVLVKTYGKTTTTKPQMGRYGKASTTTPRGRIDGRTTTVPPEYDASKQDPQNATKVVLMNATQWVKLRSYNVEDPRHGNHPLQCENFKVGEKRAPFNYSLQYKYRSGDSWETINEDLILGMLRELILPENDMFFQRTPNGAPWHNYVVYSNYVNCTVLRTPAPKQDESRCDLWMADTSVSQDIPDLCLQKFYDHCNTTHIFTVYFPNCTHNDNHFALK